MGLIYAFCLTCLYKGTLHHENRTIAEADQHEAENLGHDVQLRGTR